MLASAVIPATAQIMLLGRRRRRRRSSSAAGGGRGAEGETKLVQDVQLLGARVLLQQLARHLALGGKDDAILGQHPQRGSGVRDGLERVFDLVQTPLGGEDGGLDGGAGESERDVSETARA